MSITLIFASTENGIIGRNGNLPWPTLKEELARFKNTTLNGTVVMGRKTFISLPNGPLIKRHNIVLTKKITFYDKLNVIKFNIKNLFNKTSLEFKDNYFEVIDEARVNKSKEVFIIGGAEIYKQYEPFCDRMIWTVVDGGFCGDTKFIPTKSRWIQTTEICCSGYKILNFKRKYHQL